MPLGSKMFASCYRVKAAWGGAAAECDELRSNHVRLVRLPSIRHNYVKSGWMLPSHRWSLPRGRWSHTHTHTAASCEPLLWLYEYSETQVDVCKCITPWQQFKQLNYYHNAQQLSRMTLLLVICLYLCRFIPSETQRGQTRGGKKKRWFGDIIYFQEWKNNLPEMCYLFRKHENKRWPMNRDL